METKAQLSDRLGVRLSELKAITDLGDKATTDDIARGEAIGKELVDIQDNLKKFSVVPSLRATQEMAAKFADTPVAPVPHALSFEEIDAKRRELNYPSDKSLADYVHESESFKSYVAAKGDDSRKFKVWIPDFEVKTLFQTSAGITPYPTRREQIVFSAQQLPKLINILPSSTTDSNPILWLLETLFTNNAAETAEAGTYPEGAFLVEQKSMIVSKIAETIAVTDEQIEDVGRSRAYLENRVQLAISQKLENGTINGDGTGVNLTGLLNVSGILTKAKGAGSNFDVFFDAITEIKSTGQADASAVVIHPKDWGVLRKEQNAIGNYLLSGPYGDLVPQIWGLPVVQTNYITQGTAIVADFQNYTELVTRRGFTLESTNANEDEFKKGIQRLRASIRAALLVTRPSAVCKVTGIAAS